MSNSTPRAALPPLPYTEVIRKCDPDGEWVYSTDQDFANPEKYGWERVYTAEQVEQIRRETVQACADLCAAEQAENRTLAKGSKTAMYDWMADGAGLCRGAILALLEEPKE